MIQRRQKTFKNFNYKNVSYKKLSVLIPVYNEEKTIAKLVALVQRVDLKKQGLEKELIIVDDCSKDKTCVMLRKLAKKYANVHLFFHKKNKGKGGAVKTAIRHATGDILIIQDADLEYDPNDYVTCVKPIIEGKAVVVYGSRRLRRDNKQHSSFSFFLGGVAITLVFNLLYFQWITDEPTCYKTFRSDIIKSLTIREDRFNWEPEITAKIAKKGIKIHEVPISYYPRSVAEGKKISWKDGVEAIWALIKYRFMD